MPRPEDLDLDLRDAAFDLSDVASALAVDPAEWRRECEAVEGLFARFGDRVPAELRTRLGHMRATLAAEG